MRKEILSRFAYEFEQRTNRRINADLIVDAFPFFLYGFAFNQYYAKTGGAIIINDRGVKFRLGDFKLAATLKDIHNRQTRFMVEGAAHPMGEVAEVSEGMYYTHRLKNGEDIYVVTPSKPIVESVDNAETNGQPDIKQRESIGRKAFGSRRLSDLVSQADLIFLETLDRLASADVIDYLKQGQRVVERKVLEEYTFRLGCPQRIAAAYQVTSQNFMGEKGEDVLVINLLNGQSYPAFSGDFGTAAEWEESIQNVGPRPAPEGDETPEEKSMIDAYLVLLSDVIEAAKEK